MPPAHDADRPAQILVLEDEAIIALEIEAALSEAGLTCVTLPSCTAASNWLAGHTPDCAILDLHLEDGPCTKVAGELRNRHVPFVVFSAFEREAMPAIFSGASYVGKPSGVGDVVALVQSLSSQADAGSVRPRPRSCFQN